MISAGLRSLNKLEALEEEERERLAIEKLPQAIKAEVFEFDSNFDYSSFDSSA